MDPTGAYVDDVMRDPDQPPSSYPPVPTADNPCTSGRSISSQPGPAPTSNWTFNNECANSMNAKKVKLNSGAAEKPLSKGMAIHKRVTEIKTNFPRGKTRMELIDSDSDSDSDDDREDEDNGMGLDEDYDSVGDEAFLENGSRGVEVRSFGTNGVEDGIELDEHGDLQMLRSTHYHQPFRHHTPDPPPYSTTLSQRTQFAVNNAPHTTPSPARPSSRLIITSPSHISALKEHNAILRSHNLSLAAQNASLREEAVLADRERRLVEEQNKQLMEQVRGLQEQNGETLARAETCMREKQILEECGVEWARRESVMWSEVRAWREKCGGMMVPVGQQQSRLQMQQTMQQTRQVPNQCHQVGILSPQMQQKQQYQQGEQQRCGEH